MTDIALRPFGTMIGPTGLNGTNGMNGMNGFSPGFRFSFSTTITDSDPGAGNMRANNATFGSITSLFVDNADAAGLSVTTYLDTFDDSTTLTNRGFIRLEKATDPTVYMEFAVNGTVVDGGGYRKIPVTPLAGAIPANLTTLCMFFSRSGDSGAGSGDVVGPAGAVADRIAVFNGATGKLIKDGGTTVALLAPLASPALSGTPTVPTAAPGTNTTQAASTAFVAASFAPLASPALTGNPTAPTAAPGDNDTTIANTAFVAAAIAAGGSTWAPGAINGLTLSRATATTFGVAAGGARNEDAGAGANLALASAFTKSLGAWASGSGNGSLDTGAIAPGWYHVHLIGTTSIDILLSLSATAPTMPATYTARRRIGSLLMNGSSQITAFFQNDDEFLWDAAVVDVNAANPGATAVTRTLTVPTGVKVLAKVSFGLFNNTAAIMEGWLSSLDVSDQATQAPATQSLTAMGMLSNPTSSAIWYFVPVDIRTNTSGQIRSRLGPSTTAATSIGIITRGWSDPRGR